MINEFDIKDFKDIDCTKAKKSVTDYLQWRQSKDIADVLRFIEQVETVQRKYTKPVAALLRADNG